MQPFWWLFPLNTIFWMPHYIYRIHYKQQLRALYPLSALLVTFWYLLHTVFTFTDILLTSWSPRSFTLASAPDINTVFIFGFLLMSLAFLLALHRRPQRSDASAKRQPTVSSNHTTLGLNVSLQSCSVWQLCDLQLRICKCICQYWFSKILLAWVADNTTVPKHYSTSIAWCWCTIMNQVDLMQQYNWWRMQQQL